MNRIFSTLMLIGLVFGMNLTAMAAGASGQHDFSIQNQKYIDKSNEIIVTNRPIEAAKPEPTADTGTLLIIKKAESTGKHLQDAVFGVYEFSTNNLITEITTGENGEATASLPAREYYLLEHKAPTGYALEKEKIPFTIKDTTTVKVEVTNMIYKDTPTPDISIPQTGETFPTLNYVLGTLMFDIVVLWGVVLLKNCKNRTYSA